MTTATTSGAALSVPERFAALRIVPVIVIDDPDDAVPLARALSDGGLPVAEVTRKLVGAGLAVHEVVAERRTLEDVVLSLTGPGSDRVS